MLCADLSIFLAKLMIFDDLPPVFAAMVSQNSNGA
jgi:hypothetical protein